MNLIPYLWDNLIIFLPLDALEPNPLGSLKLLKAFAFAWAFDC